MVGVCCCVRHVFCFGNKFRWRYNSLIWTISAHFSFFSQDYWCWWEIKLVTCWNLMGFFLNALGVCARVRLSFCVRVIVCVCVCGTIVMLGLHLPLEKFICRKCCAHFQRRKKNVLFYIYRKSNPLLWFSFSLSFSFHLSQYFSKNIIILFCMIDHAFMPLWYSQ